MKTPTVVSVRALVPSDTGGADYHNQRAGHWITDSKIANPMSGWPQYRASRTSWGIGALGSFVVEVETSDGAVGFAPSIGGVPAAFIIERHLARFVEGRPLDRDSIAEAWEQMYGASLYYGRRGLALNAISAVDLALWDALGQVANQPVWQLLGEKAHERLPMYATGPRPDVAKALGFVGGKLPLPAGPAEGSDGMAENLELARWARSACGEKDDFFLAYDCYMSLDLPFAVELGEAVAEVGFRWVEECLPPDDYWGYAELCRRIGSRIGVTTGEHEATRWGFRQLLERCNLALVQPDVGWCGGMTELLRIADLAAESGVPVVPHGSSVYSYHFAVTRSETPFAEFLMMHPDATQVTPMFAPLLLDEPLPVDGHLTVPATPGFGVRLNRDLEFTRPFARNAD